MTRRAPALALALVLLAACGGSSASSGSSGSGSDGTGGGSSGGGTTGGGQGASVATCGDGVVTAPETCDDGNTSAGDGCSATCQVEAGWACPTPGQPCHRTVCGDGVVEGAEQCDDGNTLPFDGCDASCKLEPDCTGGACAGFCGDGILSPGEQCDDGNNVDGDGCSHDCKLEPNEGWSCTQALSSLPDSLTVPVLFRDFRGVNETSVPGVAACPTGLGPFPALLATGCAHPDFEAFWGAAETPGLLQDALVASPLRSHVLVPAFNAATGGRHTPSDPASYSDVQITSADTFAPWYADAPGVNRPVVSTLTLQRVTGTPTYVIDRSANAGGFFPLDGAPATWPCPAGQWCGFGLTPGQAHDFGFTTEIRSQFTYLGGEALSFTGDDDVWVFIGGKLAVDLGGLHAAITKTITLDDATATQLGLVKGQIYEMALFHAERHSPASNFTLTLGGFVKNTTVCHSVCGDGIRAPDEACDLGADNGKGKGCSATCTIERAL